MRASPHPGSTTFLVSGVDKTKSAASRMTSNIALFVVTKGIFSFFGFDKAENNVIFKNNGDNQKNERKNTESRHCLNPC